MGESGEFQAAAALAPEVAISLPAELEGRMVLIIGLGVLNERKSITLPGKGSWFLRRLSCGLINMPTTLSQHLDG
jgi:hypothetical protein